MAIKLSVILPSYKDPLLFKTIEDLLKNSTLGPELEIIAVFDAYWPDPSLIIQDPRVRYVHRGSNGGMRRAINTGVAVARGEFIGRMDEHCMVGLGWDRILTDECPPNCIISPRRYFLDPVKWEVMDIPYIDYEKLVIQDVGNGVRKFAGQRWKSRTEKRKDIMTDKNQAIQGSFWVMPKKWWDAHIGALETDTPLGPTYQDSTEVCMKTWMAGGELLITKKTWYSHKHRDFPRTHSEGTKENPSNREISWTEALNRWEDYYKNVLKPKWDNEED